MVKSPVEPHKRSLTIAPLSGDQRMPKQQDAANKKRKAAATKNRQAAANKKQPATANQKRQAVTNKKRKAATNKKRKAATSKKQQDTAWKKRHVAAGKILREMDSEILREALAKQRQYATKKKKLIDRLINVSAPAELRAIWEELHPDLYSEELLSGAVEYIHVSWLAMRRLYKDTGILAPPAEPFIMEREDGEASAPMPVQASDIRQAIRRCYMAELRGRPVPVDLHLWRLAVDTIIGWCRQMEAQSHKPQPLNADKAGSAEGESREDADTGFHFICSGDGYDITAFGQHGHFSLLGFEYLAELIANAGTPVRLRDLIDKSGIVREQHSRQRAVDREGHKDIERKVREYQEAIASAERKGSEGEKKVLEDELAELLASQAKSMRIGRQYRDLNNPVDKQRSRIQMALKRAREALRNANPPMDKLADHFETTIDVDMGTISYKHDPPIKWRISMAAAPKAR